MKAIFKAFALILVLLVALVMAAAFFSDTILKNSLTSLSSNATGTPVEVESLQLNLMKGSIRLDNVQVGNPPDYQSDYAFRIASVRARIDSRSLLSDTIHIHAVEIIEPDVVYEIKATGSSNIGTIKKNIDSYMKKMKKAPDEEKRTTRIDRLSIRDGSVRTAPSMLGGKGLSVDMPDVVLEDIDTGEEKGAGALSVILARILKSILGAAGQAAGDLGKGLKGMGSAATDAAGDLLQGLKDLAPGK